MSGMPRPIIQPGEPSGPMTADDLARVAQASVAANVSAPKEEPPPPPEKKQSPRERWLARIEEAKLSVEEATQICNEQMDPGYSTHSYTRMGGKVIITMRSRDGAHRTRLKLSLDSISTPTELVYNETLLRTNLNSSLVSIQMPTKTITLAYPNEDDDVSTVETMYRKRAMQIEKLGEQMLNLCYALLTDFDNRIAAAMSEGATEGF